MTDNDRILSWRELFGPQHRVATLTLALAVFLHAVNFFVFSTLAPSVVADIGGLDLLAWATTLYVVAAITSSAAGGLVRARLGARRALLLGAAGFGLGAAICGLAPSMEVVLLGRLIQGLGSGLLLSYSHGMIRDLFPVATWPRMFAAISSVWGIAAFSGPAIGGIFAELDAWRAGFLSMVFAAGIFAWAVTRVVPHRPGTETGGDWGPSLLLLSIGAAALLLGSVGKGAGLPVDLGLLSAAALAFAGAIVWERRARTRLFPRDMLIPTTVLGAGALYVLGISFATTGNAIFGPLMFQTLHAMSPLTAGYMVTTQSFSWTAAAILFSGIAASRVPIAMIGGPLITVAGLIGAGLFVPAGPLPLAGLSIAACGFGVGLSWGHVGTRILAAAGEHDRDRVSSVMPTLQSLGVAFGAATTGLIANRIGVGHDPAPEVVRTLATWIYAGMIPAGVVAVLAAIRMAGRTETAKAPLSAG